MHLLIKICTTSVVIEKHIFYYFKISQNIFNENPILLGKIWEYLTETKFMIPIGENWA